MAENNQGHQAFYFQREGGLVRMECRDGVWAEESVRLALTTTPLAAWKPINEAPRDGTWILLFGADAGEPHVRIGFWGDDDGWFDDEAASKSLEELGFEPSAWMPFNLPGESANG